MTIEIVLGTRSQIHVPNIQKRIPIFEKLGENLSFFCKKLVYSSKTIETGNNHRNYYIESSYMNEEIYEAVLKKVLGDNGLKRIAEFKKLTQGWDGKTGQPMSLESLRLMKTFLIQNNIQLVSPSVFMSSEGYLVLGWEDQSGGSVELEFCKDQIGFFFESLDKEGHESIQGSGIKKILELLKHSNALK